MLTSVIGDFFGDKWDNVSDYFTGYTSANQAWRFSRSGMALQDQYQRNLMRDAPSIQREGLEKAGFNPMLAIQGGVSSPSSAVSYSAPQPKGFDFGDIVDAVSSAFGNYASLSKLGSEVSLTKAQADATRANSAADVALKGAEAQKILNETGSFDPQTRRQNERYGNGLVGDVMRFVRILADGLGSDIDSKIATPLANVSSNSAKGLDGAVKVLNEKSRLVREERKRRIQEGRANPRREGRKGRR